MKNPLKTIKNHLGVGLSLEDLFGQLKACVILLNPKLQVLYINPEAEKLISTSLNLTRNKQLKNFIRKDQGLLDLAQEVVREGRSIRIHELEIIVNEAPIKIQVEMAPVGNPEAPAGVMIWMNELSLASALQEENRILDRLAMLGTMSSGLAHEIRNPLGGIRAAAEMLSRDVLQEEDREYAQIIVSEVDRLNQLITELLDFSKTNQYPLGPINLNQVLSEILLLQAGALERNHIEVKEEFDPSLPAILGNENSLKQAILNILKNSMEAMPEGGTLFLSTNFIPQAPMMKGGGRTRSMAQLLIGDTGTGIAPENLEHLFTPFFTTKSQGTGLGLMITQRIIKEHQGNIQITSEAGKGTVFKIFLKLATKSPKA